MANIVTQHNAERYLWGGDCDGWHLLKTPGLSVIQERVAPGRGEVRHYHQHAHQFFFVLSGCATLEIGEQVLKVGPRQGCSVAPTVPHQLTNQEAEDLEFLVISAPLSHGDRVESPAP
jgi:mannose-6-phosphate isomerase-like protein (cupin superfamily)